VPPFTVTSLAITITWCPDTLPMPVTRPPADRLAVDTLGDER